MLRHRILRCPSAVMGSSLEQELRRFAPQLGFGLQAVRRVEELNLVSYEMVHEATKAKYYHIDTDDANNTFCIGFRTPAANDKGTSHVLEHTVLCGSEKHPVRDPFFMMLRRSLSNFMNAMTGADYTLYPFSTTNAQDFKNLLSVYLDAVFCPLLREEDFKQEGHRIEVAGQCEGTEVGAAEAKAGETAPPLRLVHNGVVFNEMRGVVTQPSHFFSRSVLRILLPETHYVFNSGGNPPDVLELTHDELRQFHRQHYTPSNSITMTYGSMHPEPHLRALNAYFARFPRTEPIKVPTLQDHCRLDRPKTVVLDGPLDAMGNPKLQKRISVSYAVPADRNSLQDVVQLSVLDDLLSAGPSSPMYKALIESQIGAKYAPMKGYAASLSSPIISYGVAGVDEERVDAEKEVESAVRQALQSAQADGFDPRRVASVVFQQELAQRHRAADFGLNVCTGLCALCLCREGTDPADFINWLPHLQRIQEDGGRSLQPVLRHALLENTHSAVIAVSAKKSYLDSFRQQLQQLDEDLNAKATEEEKIKIQEETAAWLERVRQPQNTDLLPTLRVSDIPTAAFKEPTPVPSATAATVSTIPYATNGLVYVHGLVPHAASVVAAMTSGQPAAVSALLPNVVPLLARTGAGAYSFREQAVEAELVCSGFSFQPILNESYRWRGPADAPAPSTITGIEFGFYTTVAKLTEALELLHVTLMEPRTAATDADVRGRVLSSIKMECSRYIQSLQSQGNAVAVSAAASRLTTRAAIHERWFGLERCRAASELLEALQGDDTARDTALEQLVTEYEALTVAVAHGVRSGLLWATCEPAHQAAVDAALCRFQAAFPSPTGVGREAPHRIQLPPLGPHAGAPLDRVVSHELPIDTSFVGLAVRHGLAWTDPARAPLRVACQLLDNEYLHRRVREEGGAYGAGAGPTLMGETGGCTMSSYRDPSPDKTVRAFDEAREWLAVAKNVSQERVDEAKLRLFSKIDAPYTADSFGTGLYLHDVDQTLKQQLRDALLAVTPAQVMDTAAYLDTSAAAVAVLKPAATPEVDGNGPPAA
eukprot:gene2153-1322_t